MAKWGEGDPRWIVEERPDATNVNNWHWTEKNATPWSIDRLHNLFKNVLIGNENMECTIEEVVKCSGEATANNRKGKCIFFYEWDLLLRWKGHLLNLDSSVHSGKISIPNLSEEIELSDIEITITIDKSNNVAEILKEFMYNIGREKIRQLLGAYITALKEEYSKDLILPIKSVGIATKIEKYPSPKSQKNFTGDILHAASSTFAKSEIDQRILFIEEEFYCSASDLYNVLLQSSMVEAFTRRTAEVDANPGGQFSLYGGHVHGFFEELVPNKKIEQKWRLQSWPLGHYSKVVIELEELKNSTQMKLKQSGIPASEYDVIKANWYQYYWHSIKQTFGFGVSLTDMI